MVRRALCGVGDEFGFYADHDWVRAGLLGAHVQGVAVGGLAEIGDGDGLVDAGAIGRLLEVPGLGFEIEASSGDVLGEGP